MRVLHTIAGLSSQSGGPSTCTKDLLDGLNEIEGAKIDLLTVLPPNGRNLGAGSHWLKEVSCDYYTPIEFSHNLKHAINESDYDLYHTNALWLYINHITCKTAREKRKPYIVSPHGMLYPTALKIKAWKKKPMLWIWFNRDINQATCLHVTCREEMEHCRAFGYKGPIAIIPNPVVIPKGIDAKSSIPTERRIGFLGRLHPIKKVELLLYGASLAIESGIPSFKIDIMGAGDPKYENYLRKEVSRLGMDEIVDFIGFVSGPEKYVRLSKLWGLFVPSIQENFGMIVPEALICGTPVYASTGTPWEALNENSCGWWCNNAPKTIASVLNDLFSKDKTDLLQMGRNGRTLIEQQYEQSKVAQMMFDLYKWILAKSSKPDFVYD